MCDSLLVQSQLNQATSDSKSSHDRAFPCSSEALLDDRELASLEGRISDEDPSLVGSSVKSSHSSPYRFQLEQDVYRLERQLQEEMQLHSVLQDAMEKNVLQLCSSPCLPDNAQKLLTAISTLEVIVSRLEKEMVSLHFQLSQERNERRLAEYRIKNLSSRSISVSPRCFKPSNIELCYSPEDNSRKELADQPLESTGEFSSSESIMEENLAKTEGKSVLMEPEKLPRGLQPKSLWNQPNKLSEEMVRCMRNIFMSLADSTMPSKSSALENNCSPLSPHGYVSNSSWWSSSERSLISSWVQSPQVDVQSNSEVLASENTFDPYRVRGKFSWADIGNYGLTTEVSWMSVGKKQLEYASGALRKFRMLVEQLARVNPLHLSCNEKLAFWINLYNALIMHAYLAYGVPRSDLKLFSLMQKAAYTVGGHSFCAAAIEYVVLKMKPPLHRPQIALLLALHKFRVSEDQRKCAINNYEPLVSFALSSGMYSSPAVRIYTAKNVKEELEEAQRDFIHASVGVSTKGKLLVPKLVHCFAKNFVDDANLAVWISHYLPPNQAMFVEQCISQRRQRLLGSRNCGILPFDSRFRYLFLPDKVSLL